MNYFYLTTFINNIVRLFWAKESERIKFYVFSMYDTERAISQGLIPTDMAINLLPSQRLTLSNAS